LRDKRLPQLKAYQRCIKPVKAGSPAFYLLDNGIEQLTFFPFLVTKDKPFSPLVNDNLSLPAVSHDVLP